MRVKSCGLEQKLILLYDPAYKCAKCETWIKALHRKKQCSWSFPYIPYVRFVGGGNRSARRNLANLLT